MSNRTQIVECTICSEIEDWFKKVINETFGSDVQLRYISNADHFEMQTQVEISASGNKINEVVEFIGNTSDLLQNKLLWLNGNTYYKVTAEKDAIEERLNIIIKETDYVTTQYFIFGCILKLFTFRPDLDDSVKMEIENIFKTEPRNNSLFITYPKIRVERSQSSFHLAINILRGYHGEYLQYLNLEDILSLEMANNGQDSGPDGYLHHDIQMFLRSKYRNLYEEETLDHKNLKDFRINGVLRYFIHKFHNHFDEISISNILTANEIQSLSQLYNIDISCNNLIHIDFKSANELESVDFCAIYHFDQNSYYFLNYDSKYASENHVMHFNANDSLGPLKCSKEFSNFVLKSQNNCSPGKSNSVLKCVTEHFSGCPNPTSGLILYEFDMALISKPIISSLLKLTRRGMLEFHKMSFNYKTLKGILEQSVQNSFSFLKCHFVNDEVNPINLRKSKLVFYGMDIDLSLLCCFNNLSFLEVTNCRLLSTSWNIPIIKETSGLFVFRHTNYDMPTFMKFLYGLQCVPIIMVVSCELTPDDLVERKYFILRNVIHFIYMVIHIQILFQLFEHCEVENRITFKTCYFRLEPSETYTRKFRLKPVKVSFHNIKFDTSTLIVILGCMNSKSSVWILNSFISPLEGYITSIKTIKASYVQFIKCKIETNSLLNILSKLSKKTLVLLESCDLLRSSAIDQNILTNLSELDIQFFDMTIESQFARLILQTKSKIIFENCSLPFTCDEFTDISIQSNVSFQNMSFESPAHLDSLANFIPSSIFRLFNCNFIINFEFSKTIQPLCIIFMNMPFNFEVFKIMSMISENTEVLIEACLIQTIDPEVYTLPIKVKEIRFLKMSLQIETILCLLKGFTNLIKLGFKKCKIVCINSDELPNIKLKPTTLSLNDMTIDVQILQTLMLHLADGMTVRIANCEIKPLCVFSNISVNMRQLIFENVNYTQDVLRLLQCLNGDCSVIYSGQLSNQAIIEICTKSSVHGDRLSLPDQICSKSFYFELFTESFRTEALNFELELNAEYDLPTYLIPCFETCTNLNLFDWDEYKIKFVGVNDVTVKLEFLKNGKVIDLFFELNDLSDDAVDSFYDSASQHSLTEDFCDYFS